MIASRGGSLLAALAFTSGTQAAAQEIPVLEVGAAQYPKGALAKGMSGDVGVKLELVDGKISACQVIAPSPYPELDARSCEILIGANLKNEALASEPAPRLILRWNKTVADAAVDYGGAEPISPLYEIMRPDDYPAEARRLGEEGAVQMIFDITEKGRVRNCRVAVSSGSRSLDEASCQVLTRARFKPARDEAGKPKRASGKTSITWDIPGRR